MDMRIMGTREQEYVRQRLAELPRAVRLVVFAGAGSETADATEELAREIAEAVPAVEVQIVGEDERALEAAYGIDGRPALAIEPAEGSAPANGIRFFGFPGGYEFDSLLDAVGRVARADPGLSAGTLAVLLGLQTPLHLQVFVTQTCPYCPRMVQLAHRMALASPMVRADMVDAAEFPDLADRFRVQGVPLTVIDGKGSVVGAVPEARLLEAIRRSHPTAV
jgi:glutaredoxin-like protein